MGTRRYISTGLVSLLLAGCGGATKDGPTHGGLITDGGTGGRTASGGTAGRGQGNTAAAGARATGGGGSTGTGGARAAGGSVGAGGLDGSVGEMRCTVKDDRATIEVEALGGADSGGQLDGGDETRDQTYEGVVKQVDKTSFVLDTCPPNEDCGASLVRVTIAAPDLEFVMEAGSLVRVHFVGYCFYGCHASIVVDSLETWSGLKNPSPSIGGFYVAADDGGGMLPDAPYKWDSVRLPCTTSFEGGCGGTDEPAGVYALRFDNQVVVHMGDFGYLPRGGFSILVRNLRSYVSGACDDYWNYAHWARPVQLGD